MQKIIRQTIDLRAGGGELCWPDCLAVQGEERGHRWQVRVLDGGTPARLDGATAECYVVNGGVTTRIGADISASEVSVVFTAGCYAQSGELRAILRVYTPDGAAPAMALLRLRVQEGATDTLADPEHVVPSLHELLAQIDACRQSAQAADESAQRAANAAQGVENLDVAGLQTACQSAAQTALDAVGTANTAARNANAAAARLDGLTVSAAGLDAGAAPTADVSDVDGHRHIALGIPQGAKGDTGATPKLSIGTVVTGAPGTQASAALTGPAEAPVLSLTIPQGRPGAGHVVTVCGAEPDAAGNVALDAAAVGALPSGGTAADAHRLDGKAAAYYLRPRNLLDNSDFRAPVNQRGQGAYTSAVMNMTIDRWYLLSATSGQVQTLTLTPEGIRLTGGDPAMIQRIPLLPDGAYTLAVGYADGTVSVASTTAGALNVSDFAQVPVVVPNGSTLQWVALYEGTYTADTLPPYLPRGYAAELAECWRYYRHYAGDILMAFYPNAVVLLTAKATGMYGTGVPAISIGSLTRTMTAETLTQVSHTVVGRDAIWVGLNVTLTLGEGCYASDITLSTEP